MFRTGLALTSILVCLLLAACGNSREGAPQLSTVPAEPERFETFELKGGDVSFEYPSNWVLKERDTPGIATISTGGASATVWAYRTQALVVTPEQAAAALERVKESLLARDRNFELEAATLESLNGSPGLQILGKTEINGRSVRVRSSHFWRGLGEYVVDQIADPIQYPKANKEVFDPMVKSLHFFGEPPAAARSAPAPGG